MNCVHAQHLLLAERDGPLPSREAMDLEGHLKGCPSCRQLHADLRTGFADWKAHTAGVPVPDIREAWRDLRTAREAEHVPHPAATWFRIGLPLAAAAAFAFLLVQAPWRPASPAVADGAAIAHVNYVEPGTAGTSTLVYEDRESGWLVIWTAEADPL
jgi:predicted anti-sigma-YlaC factor YlaD